MYSHLLLIIIPSVILALALLTLYYIFLVRAILQMLRANANTVLLTFAFISLLCIPPTVVIGIMVMIIWKIHRKSLPATN